MKRKKQNKQFEYFDNCPVCQAMREAEEKGVELSDSELLEAFEKSKEKGGIVEIVADSSSKINN